MSLDLNVSIPRLKTLTFGNIAQWGTRLTDLIGDLFRKVAFEVNDVQTHHEQATTPPRAAQNTAFVSYMKGDKFVVRFFDGTADHFFHLDLTAVANQSWVYSASAP